MIYNSAVSIHGIIMIFFVVMAIMFSVRVNDIYL